MRPICRRNWRTRDRSLFEDTFSCLVSVDHPVKGNMTADQYFDAAHVSIEWGGGRRVTYDAKLISTGKRVRRQDVIAPNFTLVPEILVGTTRIATLPTRLAHQMARRFPLRVVRCPIAIPVFKENAQIPGARSSDRLAACFTPRNRAQPANRKENPNFGLRLAVERSVAVSRSTMRSAGAT
jgi:hypothetical protein